MSSRNPQDSEFEEQRRAESINEQSDSDDDETQVRSGVSDPADDDDGGRSRRPTKKDIKSGHRSVKAAALSAVIPGAGQFYTRQIFFGVLVLAIQILNVLMFLNQLPIGAISFVILWLLSVWNAYRAGYKQAQYGT